MRMTLIYNQLTVDEKKQKLIIKLMEVQNEE